MLSFLAHQSLQLQLLHNPYLGIAFLFFVVVVVVLLGIIFATDGPRERKINKLEDRLKIMEAALPTAKRMTGVNKQIARFTKRAEQLDNQLIEGLSGAQSLSQSVTHLQKMLQEVSEKANLVIEHQQAFEAIKRLSVELSVDVDALMNTVNLSKDKWDKASKGLQAKLSKAQGLEKGLEKSQTQIQEQLAILRENTGNRRDVTKALRDLQKKSKAINDAQTKLTRIEEKLSELEESPYGSLQQRVAFINATADSNHAMVMNFMQIANELVQAKAEAHRKKRFFGFDDFFDFVVQALNLQQSEALTTPPQLGVYSQGGATLPSGIQEIQEIANPFGGSPFDPSIADKLDESMEAENPFLLPPESYPENAPPSQHPLPKPGSKPKPPQTASFPKAPILPPLPPGGTITEDGETFNFNFDPNSDEFEVIQDNDA